ncbi:MAG: saccharopine dehydrogenase C-terminal domain-containing protein [Anaerolineales bacterium]|jgi:saccharopine dehydrogenase-like NADP-dependent oxidoreductase
MKIVVLGTGLVGNAIVKDFAEEARFEVIAADINKNALEKLKKTTTVEVIHADLRDKGKLSEILSKGDFIVSAVPGFMGFETLKTIIEMRKDVVDISFFGEDPFQLDDLAKENNVTAIVDCGVAPGLCNIIAGYVDTILDQTDQYICYVGGLPQLRRWPYEYKAVFSPSDVLEEYIRPARFVEYSREVVRPALSDIELIDFPQVGTLEAFNTDGLRSLGKTLDIPFMREKTLRYPGHANLMCVFKDSGFLSSEPLEVNGEVVTPLTFTSKLLFDQWQLEEGEADFTVMQVDMEGQKDGEHIYYSYYLLDHFDEKTQTTSMARTTGFTCSIITRQVIDGLFTEKGICPPEFLGRTEKCFDNLLAEYEKRNIKVEETVSKMPRLD